MLLNTIPMCSAQYEHMFNSTRVPGVDTGRVCSVASSTLLLTVIVIGKCCLSVGGKNKSDPVDFVILYSRVLLLALVVNNLHVAEVQVHCKKKKMVGEIYKTN